MTRFKLVLTALAVLILCGAALPRAHCQEKSAEEIIAGVIKEVLYAEAQDGKATLKVTNGVPVMHVYGSGSEMGKQYGTLLKRLLALLGGAAQRLIEIDPGKARQMAYAVERSIPEQYVTEMRGIARATGINYSTILIVNALGELNCSTIAAWGDRTKDGRLIFGRNLGQTVMPGLADKIGLVTVYHPEKGYTYASVGVVGILGAYSGMNEKGLSLGNTTSVNAKEEKSFRGIPPGFLYRELLETCATVEEAKRKLKDLEDKPLRASTLTVCDAGNKAVVAEIGPGGVTFREPEGQIIYATNHFLTDKMKKRDVPCWRYDKFREVEKKNEKLDVESMKKILASAFQKQATLQSIIFEPFARRLHIAFHKFGDTPTDKYSTLGIGDLFPELAKSALEKKLDALTEKVKALEKRLANIEKMLQELLDEKQADKERREDE
jgi:hypothetical protein